MAGQLSAFGFSAPDVIGEWTDRYWNADQAGRAFDRTRDFQSHMSNTAWQRGVADMQAAGLNPMLAYSQGPASSPGGSAPLAHPAGAHNVSGQYSQKTEAEVGLMESETAVNEALEEKVLEEIALVIEQQGLTAAERARIDASREVLEQEARIRLVEAESAEAFLKDKNAAELQIILAKAKGMLTEGEIDDTQYGRILRYINRLVESLGSALAGGIAGYVAGGMRGSSAGAEAKKATGPSGKKGSIFKRFLRR